MSGIPQEVFDNAKCLQDQGCDGPAIVVTLLNNGCSIPGVKNLMLSLGYIVDEVANGLQISSQPANFSALFAKPDSSFSQVTWKRNY